MCAVELFFESGEDGNLGTGAPANVRSRRDAIAYVVFSAVPTRASLAICLHVFRVVSCTGTVGPLLFSPVGSLSQLAMCHHLNTYQRYLPAGHRMNDYAKGCAVVVFIVNVGGSVTMMKALRKGVDACRSSFGGAVSSQGAICRLEDIPKRIQST